MIKLIVSDIDNTILVDGKREVSKELLSLIDQLCDSGVIVAVASGRQYPNMKRLFGPVADKVHFISENGAFVAYKDQILYEDEIDRKLALRIMEDIYAMPNCEVLASSKEISYLKPKNESYLHRIKDVVKNKVVVVNDFNEIKEPLLKIAVCDMSGIDNSKEHFINKFSKELQTVVSGKLYLDFNNFGTNKGMAISMLQEKYGVTAKETAAFGDSYNDIEMLLRAEYSYAMQHADDEVKRYANYTCDDVLGTLINLFP